MTKKTGLLRRLEAFEKLMVAANAGAIVAIACLTRKRKFRGIWGGRGSLSQGERATPAKGHLFFRRG